MESFKLVIDGIDLTKEDRKRIEKGIERAMAEALAGKTKGMVFRPVIQPGGVAHHDGGAEGAEHEGFSRIRELLPNGGILIRELMAEKELEQTKGIEYGLKSKLGEALSMSQLAPSRAPGNLGKSAQGFGGSRPA